MNRSDRRPVIQAAIGTLAELDAKLTDLLHALTDATDRNETGRRAVGGHSDPTLGQAVTLLAGTSDLDRHLEDINIRCRALHAMMARHFGPEHQPKTRHDPALEDWCQSHQRVKDDFGRSVLEPATRTIRVGDHSSGGTAPWRVCHWCYRSTLPYDNGGRGRLPTEDEIRLNAKGIRVMREAS